MSDVSPGWVALVRWGRLLWLPALCAVTSLVLPWFRPRYVGPYGSFDVGAQYVGVHRTAYVMVAATTLLVLGRWLPRGLPARIPRSTTAAGALIVLLGGWLVGSAYLRWRDVNSDAPRFAGVPAQLLHRGVQPAFFLLVMAGVLTTAMGLAVIVRPGRADQPAPRPP